MIDAKLKKDLQRFALEIRIAEMEEFKARGFGHVGGSLSVTDTLAVLYGAVMRVDPKNPQWPERDKLVCSKGHAGPAVYATLALKGFFPMEELKTLNQPNTNLPSHCDRNKTPGVDMTTGSLGQGTSAAAGIALGDKLKGRDSRTFLFIGDGEANEGQVWEAAMFTAAKKLTNLTWILDWNKKQLDGYTTDILDPFDYVKKFDAFGFEAILVDGGDVEALYEALTKKPGDRPIAIILDSVKGKGVKECEEAFGNHSMTLKTEVWDAWQQALKAELAAMDA